MSHEWIICSNEAWFGIEPVANYSNQRIRASEKYLRPVESSKKYGLFYSFGQKINRPHCFKSIVNNNKYLHIVQNWFWQKYLDAAEYKRYYFQQDGFSSYQQYRPK